MNLGRAARQGLFAALPLALGLLSSPRAAAEPGFLTYQFVGSGAHHGAIRTINDPFPLVGGCGQSNSGSSCRLRPDQQCCSHDIASGDGGKTVTVTVDAVRGDAMFVAWQGICEQPCTGCALPPGAPIPRWCEGGRDCRGFSPDRLRGGGFQCTVTLPNDGDVTIVTRWELFSTGFPDRTCNQFEALAGSCVGVPPPPPGTTTTVPSGPPASTTTLPPQIGAPDVSYNCDPKAFVGDFFRRLTQQYDAAVNQARAALTDLGRGLVSVPFSVADCVTGKVKTKATVRGTTGAASQGAVAGLEDATGQAAGGKLRLIAKGAVTFSKPGAAGLRLRATRGGRKLIDRGQTLRLVFEVTAKTKGNRATQTGEVLVPAQ
jgi:hypothetical protein